MRVVYKNLMLRDSFALGPYDKVLCIEGGTSDRGETLITGKEYIVEYVQSNGGVKLFYFKSHWRPNRFKPVDGPESAGFLGTDI